MNAVTLLWIVFVVLFVAVSAMDYYVTTHRKAAIDIKGALRWAGLWVGLALGFGVAIQFLHPRGGELGIQYIAGYLTCAFAHPSVEAFSFWGFMGTGIAWNDAGNSGHDLKPVWNRVHALIHDEWRTRESLVTDADGVVRFRGFLGEYELRFPDRTPASRARRFTHTREQTGAWEFVVG